MQLRSRLGHRPGVGVRICAAIESELSRLDAPARGLPAAAACAGDPRAAPAPHAPPSSFSSLVLDRPILCTRARAAGKLDASRQALFLPRGTWCPDLHGRSASAPGVWGSKGILPTGDWQNECTKCASALLGAGKLAHRRPEDQGIGETAVGSRSVHPDVPSKRQASVLVDPLYICGTAPSLELDDTRRSRNGTIVWIAFFFASCDRAACAWRHMQFAPWRPQASPTHRSSFPLSSFIRPRIHAHAILEATDRNAGATTQTDGAREAGKERLKKPSA